VDSRRDTGVLVVEVAPFNESTRLIPSNISVRIRGTVSANVDSGGGSSVDGKRGEVAPAQLDTLGLGEAERSTGNAVNRSSDSATDSTGFLGTGSMDGKSSGALSLPGCSCDDIHFEVSFKNDRLPTPVPGPGHEVLCNTV